MNDNSSLLLDQSDVSAEDKLVVPNYIETKLSQEKRQECRGIVKTINQFGVNQRMKLYLIYLLSLELENREAMMVMVQAAAGAKKHLDDAGTDLKKIIVDG